MDGDPTAPRRFLLRYVRASGETMEDMRAAVRGTPLPRIGDAVLVWANEGDLCLMQFSGEAVPMDAGGGREPDPPSEIPAG